MFSHVNIVWLSVFFGPINMFELNLCILEPYHVRAQNNKRYYQQLLTENGVGDNAATQQITRNKPEDDYRSSAEFKTYEKLCRGEKTHVTKHLFELFVTKYFSIMLNM